ncbi:alpha/beta hydrolase family protein [Acidaminobacterium chupaoyuni]
MNKILKTDFAQYRFLSGLEAEPDGEHAVMISTMADLEENRYRSDLQRIELKTGKIKALTSCGDAKSFAFYGNGVIFPALRSEQDRKKVAEGELLTVFYALDFAGGEATEAFRLPLAGATAKQIRRGLYLISAVHDNARPDFEAMKGEARQKAWEAYREEADYQVVDEAPFWFNGKGFTNKKRNRLYLYDTGKKKLTPLTAPMFDVRACCVSPCGGFIAYAGALVDKLLDMHSGIWLYEIATGETRCLFEPRQYSSVYAMEFLGEKIMFTAEEHNADWMRFAGTNLYSVDCKTAEIRLEIPVAETEDFGGVPGNDCRYGGGHKMKAHDGALYYTAAADHHSILRRWQPGCAAEKLYEDDSFSPDCFDICGERLYAIGFENQDLAEVFRLELKDGKRKRLTSCNRAALKNKYVAAPEKLTFTNREGNVIEGWVLKPIDYDPGKNYPAALDIHGGPRAIFGTCFFHQMQMMASDGVFVMYCNPTGSGGRGDRFADISGRYGTVDYDDLMQFTDEVLKKYPAIDEKRLAVLGGSYGGFMTNWIIGKTHRFAAAASQRSIASWITLFGTCDIGLSFDLREVQATPFTDMYKMWDQSPMKFANNAKTPTLFINSMEDYRCWLPEGISMYAALQLHGVPSRMCLFKGENHELSRSGKPLHRVRRLTEITNWLYQYIQK